jgi:hypothetical protein
VSRSFVQQGAPPGHAGPAVLPNGRDDGDGMARTPSLNGDGNADGNPHKHPGTSTHVCVTQSDYRSDVRSHGKRTSGVNAIGNWVNCASNQADRIIRQPNS